MHKICCRMMQLFGRGIPIYLFLIENVNMDMRIFVCRDGQLLWIQASRVRMLVHTVMSKRYL